ncbi:MAG: HesB/IscA family protein [Candidatus Bipolaricaulia bacterium]
MQITITDVAAEKIKKMMEEADRDVLALAVQRAGCGCEGLMAELKQNSFSEEALREYNGIKIHVDPDSEEQLEGTHLDYIVSEQGEGFTIFSPNLAKSCGC